MAVSVEEQISIQRIVSALEGIQEELRLTREQNAAAAKINEFNLRQIEAMTQGGIVGAMIVPPGASGPRKLT